MECLTLRSLGKGANDYPGHNGAIFQELLLGTCQEKCLTFLSFVCLFSSEVDGHVYGLDRDVLSVVGLL